LRLSLSLPDIIRISTLSEDAAINHIVAELDGSGGVFNYIDATKRIKSAYKGLHRLDSLIAVPPSRMEEVGQCHNIEVVKLAAPLAFGRTTNVFDLGGRFFAYGEARQASYRAPFLYTESGTVKLCYLQPRKSGGLSFDQASLYISIVKKFLLDSEFYGEKVDVEVVDVAQRIEGRGRVLRTFDLSSVEIWSDDKIAQHLKVVRLALDFIETQGLVKKKRRPLKDRDLPMFF
jgi:hypothetical protein